MVTIFPPSEEISLSDILVLKPDKNQVSTIPTVWKWQPNIHKATCHVSDLYSVISEEIQQIDIFPQKTFMKIQPVHTV